VFQSVRLGDDSFERNLNVFLEGSVCDADGSALGV
jgi:hypothetical protein